VSNACLKEATVTRLLIPAVLLIAAPALAQQPAAAVEPQVVVGGEGVVQAAPDRAWISVGAESRASSAREAQRRNTEAMTPVLAKLKAAGIPDEAIRTIGYDLQYEWDYVNNKRVGRGYVARNTVEVRVDDISRVGELLEMAVGSGATTVSGIRFGLKDRARLEQEALRLAVADARGRAEAIASATGRAVDRIVRVEERGVVSVPPPPRPMFREAQLAAADAAPPISAGQLELRAEVAVTVTLK
jgi:uncharacterized protein YggE